MKQKLMAVAVAGALAAPALAFAQASTVQIYGYVNAEYGFAKSLPESTATNSWDGLNSPGSFLGFKGEEKLSGGLSAFFQCETDLGFLKGDSGGGTAHLATQGGWCSRNSALGLKGGFGSVYIGSWDSPTKRAVGAHRVAGETGFLGVQHLLISGGGAFTGSYSVRNANSISWDSPNFNGFSVSAQTTTTGEAKTVATAGLKGRHTSFSLSYAAGPVALVAAHTKADDNRSASQVSGTADVSTVVGASYTIGAAKISALYIDSKSQPTTTSELGRKSWNLGATYALSGPHTLVGVYTVAGDTKQLSGTTSGAIGANTGAKIYTLGYRNALSKRTSAGLYYVSAKNDSSATGYSVGGQSTSLTAGASSSVVVMQLTHSF